MADFAARIEVDGPSLASVDATLAALPDSILAQIERAQNANAIDMQSTARDEVQRGARTGRTYRRGKKGHIVHQASAPGEPPKSDTGNLVSHIRGFVKNRFTAVLEAATKYARFLEFGTRSMGARPFLDRAAAIVLSRATARLVEAIRAGVRALGNG